MESQKPHMDQNISAQSQYPTIPPEAYTTRLSAAVVKQIRRLGGNVKRIPKSKEKIMVKTIDGNEFEITEPIRRFLRDVQWDRTISYRGEINTSATGWSIWSLQFYWGELDEFECSRHRPYMSIAHYDGGNFLVVVDLADPKPGNPTVHLLDHDDSDLPMSFRMSLSRFLAQLEPEK